MIKLMCKHVYHHVNLLFSHQLDKSLIGRTPGAPAAKGQKVKKSRGRSRSRSRSRPSSALSGYGRGSKLCTEWVDMYSNHELNLKNVRKYIIFIELLCVTCYVLSKKGSINIDYNCNSLTTESFYKLFQKQDLQEK